MMENSPDSFFKISPPMTTISKKEISRIRSFVLIKIHMKVKTIKGIDTLIDANKPKKLIHGSQCSSKIRGN